MAQNKVRIFRQIKLHVDTWVFPRITDNSKAVSAGSRQRFFSNDAGFLGNPASPRKSQNGSRLPSDESMKNDGRR
jgi:hypothetical protein